MTDEDSSNTSTDHPVYEAFRLVGYSPSDLTDPGYVTREDIEDGGWRIAKWNSNGVTLFDVTPDDIVDASWAPTGVAVQYGNGTQQPIGFVGEEYDPLNAEILPMSQLRGRADASVVFLVGPEVSRDVPDYDREEAIYALSLWGSEGFIPAKSAEAVAETFDTAFGAGAGFDDDDAEGVSLMRAPHVVKHLAAAAFGTVAEEDSTTIGHKKRRRTEFYDNLETLAEEYGVDVE